MANKDSTGTPNPLSEQAQQQRPQQMSAAERADALLETISQISLAFDKGAVCEKALGKKIEAHNQIAPENLLIKPSWKRWIILILFCMNAGNKAFQWIQVPAATTKATILYGVDNYVINLASILFMMAFVFLCWPACFVIEMIGIRRAVLMASCGTMLGAAIKCFSCHEEGVWLLMVGSVIVSLSEQLIFSVPSRLASVWFPDSQVSLCVAICVVGNQVGVAMGFLVPHWYLNNTETRYEIGMGFYHMFIATTIFSAVTFILCIIAFDEEPQYAPGAARLRQRELERVAAQSKNNKHHLRHELRKLFGQVAELAKNKQLLILSQSYGIIIGVNYTLQTLLDQMLGPAWPDDTLLVGQAGFAIIVAGVVTTPLWGRAMDSWHAYKTTNVLIALGNVISLSVFGYAMHYQHSVLSIIIAAFIYGLFSVGYCVSILEYAVELTYPAPELVTSSYMNVMPQIHGTVFILLGSVLVDNYGNNAASIFNVSLVTIGLILVLATKEQLKRQEAIEIEKSNNGEKKQQNQLAITEKA